MLSFACLREALAAPGLQKVISSTAPTCLPHQLQGNDAKQTQVTITEPTNRNWQWRLNHALDRVVEFAGSQFAFFMIFGCLVLWALLGIRFGRDNNYQVLISNVQAILCYTYDSLLMRQQFTSFEKHMTTMASMRSRMITVKRMLRQMHIHAQVPEPSADQDEPLPREGFSHRISMFLCRSLGHFTASIGFWLCIILWVAFGPYCGWSNSWQLYINSATSALMIFVFAFLANIRAVHDELGMCWWQRVMQVDSGLEETLRQATGMVTPNGEVQIPPAKYGKLQRAIFYYADVVGTLVGIVLLILVLAAWLAVGSALHFDSNWWLIIGTYAGLIGMHDGFILHNVQDQLLVQEDAAFDALEAEDAGAFDILSLPHLDDRTEYQPSLSVRISARLAKVWAHRYTIVVGIIVIIGLLAGATALDWSYTGQLLCNVPPSIIESYIMIALIAVHSQYNDKRMARLQAMYNRRMRLRQYVDNILEAEQEAELKA